jgi:hypothetical protein
MKAVQSDDFGLQGSHLAAPGHGLSRGSVAIATPRLS